MSDARPRPVRFADLGKRLASGVVLAVIAILNVWAGGAWATGFLSLALALMLWEYHRMVTGSDAVLAPGLAVAVVAGVLALVATEARGIPAGFGCLAAGLVGRRQG